MLEKTAASLEPCGLQRILPVATNSFRSRRQLHTAFWQHGAAELELTNAWQLLMHGVFDVGLDTASSPSSASTSDPRHPSLRASTFLLDFLYPLGTAAFLRRFSPSAIDRLDTYKPTPSFAKVSPRLYSTSAPARTSENVEANAVKDVAEQPGVADGTAETLLEENVEDTNRHHDSEEARFEASKSSRQSSTDAKLHKASNTVPGRGLSQQDLRNIFGQESSNHLEELMSLLILDNPEDADRVWYHYTLLDAETREHYLGQTLVFMSKTGRVTDSWKVSELFNQLDSSRWDSYSFVAGLEAELDLQNTQKAQEIFAKGLEMESIEHQSLIDALDLMLTTALKSSSMTLLYDLWRLHDKMTARLDFSGITSQLRRVSTVPGLPDIVIGLKPYLKKVKGLKGVESLKKLLVRRALMVCPNHQVLTILRMADDPLAYEEFIRGTKYASTNRQMLVTQVYKIYRELPQCCPSHAVLYTVFEAYKSIDSRDIKFPGLEMLWGDWLNFHETPTRRAYQKFMAFYASVGSKKHVYQLWKEYIKIHGEANVLQGDDTFTHLLQVHAVRQEVSEVQRIFDEIASTFRLEPNRHCWCVLLNAYVKAGDYDGAISTFEKLCVSLGGMDRVSVGTMMQMAADRGDLGFTIHLYRRARRERIQTNDVPILCSLIDAYCHNDLFQEAEDLCVRAAAKGIKEPRMWNKIVAAYALRRNLVGINKLLNRMTELEVPYNHYTYQELLKGLALCKQSQHALHLLSVAIRDGAFQVNEEHFHIIMGAFIKSGEADIAAKIHRLMQQCGFRESADSLLALMTAFAQWSRLPHKRRKGHSQQTLLSHALSRFYKAYGIRNVKSILEDKSQSPSQAPIGDNLLRPNKQAFQFSRLIFIFTQMKDYAKVQELVGMYRYISYGDASSSEPLPIQILNSIMWADLSEKKYDNLQQAWNTMFSMAQEGSLSPGRVEDLPRTRKVSPRYRYILNDGIKIMQTMYIEQGDAISLQKLIEEVRTAGFEIDSRNWNLHVQGLIQCHSYMEAFNVCEKWLMPNWSGWARARQRENMKNAIPLDLRRKGTWPRYLRPVSHTLFYLTKGYMELDKMRPWAGEAGRIMASVKEDCPRCYRAISSMTRTGTALEQRILGAEGAVLSAAEDAQEDFEDDGEQMYSSDGDSVADSTKSADEDDWTMPTANKPAETQR